MEITRRCLETISDDNLDLRYIIVDDASTDGTGEFVEDLKKRKPDKYVILHGDGQLYWAGGMRKGMEWYLSHNQGSDYVLLLNDDVLFEPGILGYMIERSKNKKNAVIVGVTGDSSGKLSYGGVKYKKGTVKCDIIPLNKANEVQCDTFNCNCVLLPDAIFRDAGNFDDHYTHSLADYDYGFKIRKMGYNVYETDRTIGHCNDNDTKGTWHDTDLKRMDRIRKKESPKGLPFGEWYYYLRKNFGLGKAIWHSFTPYIRILLKI